MKNELRSMRLWGLSGWVASFPIYIALALGVGYAWLGTVVGSIALALAAVLSLSRRFPDQKRSVPSLLLICGVPQVAWVAAGRLWQPVNVSTPQDGLGGVLWLLVFMGLVFVAELTLLLGLVTRVSDAIARALASRFVGWACFAAILMNLVCTASAVMSGYSRPDESGYPSTLQAVSAEPVLQKLGLGRLGGGRFPAISDRAAVYWDPMHQLWAIEDGGALVGFVSPENPTGRVNKDSFDLGLAPPRAWVAGSLAAALFSIGWLGYWLAASLRERRRASWPGTAKSCQMGWWAACAGLSLLGAAPLVVRFFIAP